MTEENALAAAIAALKATINDIPCTAPPVAAPGPVLEPYKSNQPFNQGIHAGSLQTKQFHLLLRQRSMAPLNNSLLSSSIFKSNPWKPGSFSWYSPSYCHENVLTNYHHITEMQVTTSQTPIANHQPVQNAKELFLCLKMSMSGNQ